MLQYHTVDNLMTPAPNDFMAQTVNVRSYNDGEITDLMLKRGSLLTKADILAAQQVRTDVILDIVADGGGVNTRLYSITPSIGGVFDGATDSFDRARHKVNANINASSEVRAAARRVKTEKVQVADPSPYIVEAKDVVSGSVNEQLTPGGILQLRGSRLKFFQENPENGIFLLHESGTATQLTVIAENKPARLMAMLPANLESGAYTVEVRTTLSSTSREGKTLKTGRFVKTLTV